MQTFWLQNEGSIKNPDICDEEARHLPLGRRLSRSQTLVIWYFLSLQQHSTDRSQQMHTESTNAQIHKYTNTQMHKYTNTKIHKYKNTQIHKYTNTAYEEVPERLNTWYVFEKRIVQGYQKLYPHVPNTQIQKLKYSNIQIQYMTKCQKNQTCGIFLKRGLFKGVKNYIPIQHKLKNLSFA